MPSIATTTTNGGVVATTGNRHRHCRRQWPSPPSPIGGPYPRSSPSSSIATITTYGGVVCETDHSRVHNLWCGVVVRQEDSRRLPPTVVSPAVVYGGLWWFGRLTAAIPLQFRFIQKSNFNNEVALIPLLGIEGYKNMHSGIKPDSQSRIQSKPYRHNRGCFGELPLRIITPKRKQGKQPEGFVISGNENKVCKLVKSLFSLKQAPKQWHQKFDDVVLSNGFALNQADKCVYSKFDTSGKGVIICLYVDDMLIFGTDQDQVDTTKEFLSSKFDMKDMGEADVILGLKIIRGEHGITISQSHYIEKMLNKFNMKNCSPIGTPMDPTIKLVPNKGIVVNQLEYSRAIGSLMYAMISTRPNIAFAVGKLSRYTHNPGLIHWQAINRVFKYLKGTMDYGLTYTGFPSVLEGYSDASWITNKEDHSSTSGWVFLLGDGAICWASKKQSCITTSTMESEFVALATAGKEAKWLRNLIYEIPLWHKQISSIFIRCDSQATLAKAYSEVYNGKSRHLGVRHNMIRDLITNGVISVVFVKTQHNLADHLTKGLNRDLVKHSAIGMGLKSTRNL
ncbi:hypothetical protein OSB04_002065 [Centaurea solstitialis]|uniref:Reverse transcriptase Ty1/copia-type domain-containing protein n=1 Tax=Centaurea solstitialis TaxID=347529 RepID=A0AA38TSK8_9ASTR|nr:hypothetical protein OSB04_002065 [Centaurea solstitialis]